MTTDERLKEVNERIARAAQRTGREPRDITLVAVSKTFGIPEILEARAAGQNVFGENRAQEFARKVAEIPDEVEWHFVGHLQKNKVKHVVGAAALIHSVDSLRLAESIGKRAESLGIRQDVLIEVNIASDERKHGVAPDDVAGVVRSASDMEGLRLRGLMTIPPWPDDPEDSRSHYSRLRRLRDDLEGGLSLELSMGMTRDFDVAIEEGATLVRVGEAIFGSRHT